ncbi:MAG TPA: ATP-binding protein [Polyangia bacterium]
MTAYAILDTPPEAAFDRLTRLAAELFDVPMAVVTIVDRDRQWFKSRFGVEARETPREVSFCAHTIEFPAVLVVEDATTDPRFADNPLVNQEPWVRFYAGAPLVAANGERIGAFGILDKKPRQLLPEQRLLLTQLAVGAMNEIALRSVIQKLAGDPALIAERSSFDTDRRLRFITEQLPAILWTTDRELTFTSAIGAGLTKMGRTPREIVGVNVADFVAESPEAWRHVTAHRDALEGRGSSTDVWFSGRAYQTRVDPLRDEEGEVVGTIGVALDITDRVQSEESVRQSEARYRMIARATNDVVRDWNIETGEWVWNDGVANAFHYPRHEVGSSLAWWSEHIHVADRERVLASLREAIESQATSWSDEYRFLRADGSHAMVLDRGFLSRNPAGGAVRMIASMLDVSESRAIEAKLIQAERLASMGTLAAGVAHEINNPLTYVMANVGFVSERLVKLAASPTAPEGLSDRLNELVAALNEAQEGAVRVRQIVRDLKVFSRSDDDNHAAVDVTRLLESSLSMVWNEIRHRARVVKELAAVPLVQASESRLGQVFLNLLINAAQAIEEGNASANEIGISTATDGAGRAIITISDTGGGISPDVIGRIFDPFFTTKPIGVGTGLGLFICHGIIKGLGGELTAESVAGRGARFKVTLPPAQKPARLDAPATPGPEDTRSRRRRVLLVDDEVHLAQGLQRALSPEHDIVLATSGREAKMILAEDDRFDVVLCDLMMPDVTGMEVFAYVTAERPHLAPCMVFMTGGAFTARARTFLDEIPNLCIEKPFELARLRDVIRNTRGPRSG